MFESLLNRLTQADTAPLPDADARLALAALLVRIARADGDYAPGEIARIDQLLSRRYGLTGEAVARLRAEAESLEAEAPDTVRFTREIKDHVPYEQREQVIETLWDIVLADGRRDDEEDALMRTVAPLLGVSDVELGPRAQEGRRAPRMIAALPMYDRPETAAAHDALWSAIAGALERSGARDVPDRLTRDLAPDETWRRDDLLLGQVCGLPFRAGLHRRLALVGTPDYRLGNTAPGHYRSAFVVRRRDPRETLAAFAGACLAYNDGASHSGWAAAQLSAQAAGFRFDRTLATGAHTASARAVALGRADIAAVDAVTWRGIERWDDFAVDLRVLGFSEPAPGLAFAAPHGADLPGLRAAVAQALAALDRGAADTLGMYGLVEIPPEAYMAVPTPPAP